MRDLLQARCRTAALALVLCFAAGLPAPRAATADSSSRVDSLVRAGHEALRSGDYDTSLATFREADTLADGRSFDAALGLTASLRATLDARQATEALAVARRLVDLASRPIETAAAHEMVGLMLYERAYYSSLLDRHLEEAERVEAYRQAIDHFTRGLEAQATPTLHLRHAFATLQLHTESLETEAQVGTTDLPPPDSIVEHLAAARGLGVPAALESFARRAECLVGWLADPTLADALGGADEHGVDKIESLLVLDETRLLPEATWTRSMTIAGFRRPLLLSSTPRMPPMRRGMVEIWSVVDATGTVRCAWPAQGVPAHDLELARRVEQLRFTPAQLHGEPIPVRHSLRFHLGPHGLTLDAGGESVTATARGGAR